MWLGVKWWLWLLLAACVMFHVLWNGAAIVQWADGHEGLAAWVQAIGVFVAVLLAGRISAKQARDERRLAQIEILGSAAAICREAASAAEEASNAYIAIRDGQIEDPPFTKMMAVKQVFEELNVLSIPGYWEIAQVLEARTTFHQLCTSVEWSLASISIMRANSDAIYNFNFTDVQQQAAATNRLCNATVERLHTKARRIKGGE